MAPKGKIKGSASGTQVDPIDASSKDKLAALAGKIEETDEMKLKMLAALDKPDPDDVLYPPELNAHLIEQLKIMTCESNELRKIVIEKDEIIKEQNKTITELNNRIRDIISGTGPTISSKSAGVISAKLTELCKQNRHLVSEVEGYKTKNAALERKIMQLEVLNKEHEKLDICLCKEDNVDFPSPDEIKELNAKLANVNKRLVDSKKKNIELKNEIITATKVLQHELGDKFTSLKELQNHVMGWKGRAEKIILLQARIKELEDMLNLKTASEKRIDVNNHLRELEAKRKREMELAMKDYKILKDENQELKRKMEAAKSRVKNLECDSTVIRQKIQTFIEKSNADDQLINEQRNQIKTLELYYQDILKENTAKMNKMYAEIAEHQKVSKNTDAKVDALKRQATEKATKIEELRAQLLRYEECSLQSVFFTPMKTATDNEIQKLSQLVLSLNKRLDEERANWDKLDTANRKLKEKKKRLEKKVVSLEVELKNLQEIRKSRLSRSSIIKDLQQGDNGFMPVFKKRSSLSATMDKPSESSTAEPEQEPVELLDKEELKYRLELTEEKLKIVEDKLKMVEEEKQEDFNNLTEMIRTSKQLFNEALIVLQKEKCICNNGLNE